MELFIIWLAFIVFSALLANGKNRSALGWALIGALLGPFGLLVVFFPALERKEVYYGVGPGDRKCPFCAEIVKPEAIVCKHCGRSILPGAPLPKS